MRYFIELSYFGKNFHGWQIQPDVSSVQEKLQQVLSIILREEINIVAAGRTDSGVHATQMYAHFDFNDEINIDLVYKCNSILTNDVVINDFFLVNDDSHARFDAVSRSYEYRIFLGRNPFNTETTWQVYFNLDVELMNQACQLLFEYTDFECFSKVQTEVATFNCVITNAYWSLKGKDLIFNISANRFLRNMVRAIVGTLLDVGKGVTSLTEFKEIIESKNRCRAGLSVPAKGLFLTKVEYDYIDDQKK